MIFIHRLSILLKRWLHCKTGRGMCSGQPQQLPSHSHLLYPHMSNWMMILLYNILFNSMWGYTQIWYVSKDWKSTMASILSTVISRLNTQWITTWMWVCDHFKKELLYIPCENYHCYPRSIITVWNKHSLYALPNILLVLIEILNGYYI